MFSECDSSQSLSDIKRNIKYVTNMIIIRMFYRCCTFQSLSDISKWDTKSIMNMMVCSMDVVHYNHYQIFQNRILKM